MGKKMSRVLVTYSTNSGSTAEVAEQVGEYLKSNGHSVDVLPLSTLGDLENYDSAVIGAPMIFGWQSAARQFIKKNESALAGKKVAYFACAMRLTQVPGEKLPDVPVSMDPSLAAPPIHEGSLTIKERFTTLGYYLKPMVQSAPRVKPVSVAFFNGKLEMFRLKWWQAAFVMLVVQGVPGDYRDWDYIKSWVNQVSPNL
jgi:menaquinone-dependent protoporphyrinogen oxidase